MTKEISPQTQIWIDSIATGKLTMGQRKIDALIKLEGSLAPVIAAAKEAGIHLVQLTDDKGTELLAGSQHPFKVLC